MTLRDMFYLTTVAEEKSITKASAKLFIAQSALSQCVQRVEKELGAELFVRTPAGVRPTAEGNCFLKFASNTLLEQRNMLKQLQDIRNNGSGEVRVGLTGTQATYVLPHFLPQFKKQYPNIDVILVEESSTVIEEKLVSGEIDIGIIHFPVLQPSLNYFVLSHDDMVIIPRSCSPFQKYIYQEKEDPGPCLDIHFLKEEPLILPPPGQRSRMICDQIFAKADIQPVIKQTPHYLVTIDALAQVDYATAIMPRKQISETLRRRGYYYFDQKIRVPYSFCVATLDGQYISDAARKMLDLLHAIKDTF